MNPAVSQRVAIEKVSMLVAFIQGTESPGSPSLAVREEPNEGCIVGLASDFYTRPC